MPFRAVFCPLACRVFLLVLPFSLALSPSWIAAQSDQVHPGPEMLLPRAAHTATTLSDDRVLIAGGCTADSCNLTPDGATTEIFDPAQHAFAAGPCSARRE